jgi:hypothetical protein
MIIKQNTLEWKGTLKARTSTEFLIFHHAESTKCSLEDIHSWHKIRGWVGVGYNFFIRKDGTVYEGRPIWASDADAFGHNDDSLSCCFEGNFEVETMTDAQVKSGIELAKYCRKLYPRIRLCRHKDVNDTACPGKNFNDSIIIEGSKDDVQPQKDYILAIDTLNKAGILGNKELWTQYAVKDANIKALMFNMAKYITTHK